MRAEGVVYIVDDDEAVCRSLGRLLRQAGFVTEAFRSGAAFLDGAARRSNGCLLLDVCMPEMDGFGVQSQLNERGLKFAVVVMTGQGDVRTAVRAMKAGAVDFIEKPFDCAALLETIEDALSGVRDVVRDHDAAQAAERAGTLSPRERQVLVALTAGRSNKVIAHELGLSVRTIEVHRARMLERLGIRTLAEAIRLAVLAKLA